MSASCFMSAATRVRSGRRPDRELVAGRIREVEPPAARKRVGLLEDFPAGRLDGFHALLEVVGIQDHERPFGARVVRLEKSADFPAARALNSGVAGAVVVELPAEGRSVET